MPYAEIKNFHQMYAIATRKHPVIRGYHENFNYDIGLVEVCLLNAPDNRNLLTNKIQIRACTRTPAQCIVMEFTIRTSTIYTQLPLIFPKLQRKIMQFSPMTMQHKIMFLYFTLINTLYSVCLLYFSNYSIGRFALQTTFLTKIASRKK